MHFPRSFGTIFASKPCLVTIAGPAHPISGRRAALLPKWMCTGHFAVAISCRCIRLAANNSRRVQPMLPLANDTSAGLRSKSLPNCKARAGDDSDHARNRIYCPQDHLFRPSHQNQAREKEHPGRGVFAPCLPVSDRSVFLNQGHSAKSIASATTRASRATVRPWGGGVSRLQWPRHSEARRT